MFRDDLKIIIGDWRNFLDNIFKNLESININVSKYKLDHIAYRATSIKNFNFISQKLTSVANKIHRITIRNRYVDTYQLNNPIAYKGRIIRFLEILAPAEGDMFQEGLEHAEFVVDDSTSLNQIVAKYKDIKWNTNSINREIGAEIGIQFDNNANIKLKNMTMPEIIRLEKDK